ncbi:MAG: transglutaminase-like domain-containing protein [Candidatus Aminicenantes bacterium]|nr:transglutaminase-like domain-containing protein [Candidatus Aminicenantes bacterium]
MKKFLGHKIFEKRIGLSFLIILILIIAHPLASGHNLKNIKNGYVSNQVSSEEKTLWYVVKLSDIPAGYAWERSKKVMTSQGPVIKGISELRLAVRRLGTKIELSSVSEIEETERGDLRRLSLSMKLSNLETKTQAEVGEKVITVRSSAGGKEFTQKITFNERLLGPEGIIRLTLSSLKKVGDEIEYSTYLPELNQVIKGKRRAEGWEEVKLLGFANPFKTLRVVEIIEPLATKRTLWFDLEGKLIQSQETSPLGELKIYLASKEDALAAVAAQGLTDIPFENTLIRANVRLPKARSIEKMTLRLTFKQGDAVLPPFSSHYQRVISLAKDSLILEIERPAKPIKQEAGFQNGQQDKKEVKEEVKEYLQANTYLNIDDHQLKTIATQLTMNLSSDWAKVLRLRDWVSQNVRFDPGIVFAASNEVIRQRRGTCVSLAILLTSLARAVGLPARFVMGYAYLNGVWGGHAWSEIYVDGLWLPFDAALPSFDVADAARIALVASSLNQGLGEIISVGQRFFSRIEITILDYQLEGRNFKAPFKLYEVKDNKYTNFGLNLSVQQIDSFSFAELNKAWPDNTVLVMRNETEEVRLLQQIWRPVENLELYLYQLAGPDFNRAKIETFIYHGEKAYRLKNKNQAVAFFFQGTDLWQVQVKSTEATKLLAKALQAIHFKK